MNKFIRSFGYAANGVLVLFKTQHNARVHLVATFLVVLLGFFFKISSSEWLFILLAIGLVIVAEALNSAIEFLADFVTEAYHDKIKKSKDLAAGGVLIASAIAAIVGAIIFLPKVSSMVSNIK